MDKHLVVVARQWHEPFVRVDITDTAFQVAMSLEDFAMAVSLVSGLPAREINRAFEAVVAGLKTEGAKAF